MLNKNSSSFPSEAIFTVFLLLLTGSIIWLSLSYEPDANRVPLVISVPTFGILLYILLSQLNESVELPNIGPSIQEEEDITPDSEELQADGLKRALAWIGSMATFTLLFGILGDALVLTYLFLRIEGEETRVRAGTIAVTTAVLVYIIFGLVLGSDLYPGFLVELIVLAGS